MNDISTIDLDYGSFVDNERFVGRCEYMDRCKHMQDLKQSRDENKPNEGLEVHYAEKCSRGGRCLTRRSIIESGGLK
tara:strand:+ start:3334 stop:3564 length:231 start_codon:yes stop_codon:yes gene_type:complete